MKKNPDFTGDVDECLRHYIKANGLLDNPDARSAIIKYTGASRSTALHWINDHGMPSGRYRVVVRYFLKAEGYEVTELESLDEVVFEAGLLLAEKLITPERLAELVGTSPQNLFQILHGGHSPSASVRRSFETQIKELRKGEKQAVALPIPAQQSSSSSNDGGNMLLAETIARLTAQLRPALVRLAEEGSEQEIEAFHAAFGTREDLFEISNALGALSTKEALTRFRRAGK